MLPRIGPCRRITSLTLFLATSVFLILFTAFTYHILGRPRLHIPLSRHSFVDATNDTLHEFILPPIPVDCSIHVGPPEKSTEDGLATVTKARDLLCRPVDATARGVPRLFHQSWKNEEVPAKFLTWSEDCRRLHPDWEYVLWTDDDNLALVQTYFPWLEETYRGLAGPIYRADFVRNLYMYMYGGVYADLDTTCLRNTADALQPYRIPSVAAAGDTGAWEKDPNYHRAIAVLGMLGDDSTYEQSIPNAWMASSPRHPFWLLPIEHAVAEVRRSKSFMSWLWYRSPDAEHVTGPIALRTNVLKWKTTLKDLWNEVVLLPSDLVYPYSWKTPGKLGPICSTLFDTFNETKCREDLKLEEKGSLAVTYWSHTHNSYSGTSGHNIEQVSHER